MVVTGPPASGKSRVARALARELEIPFLSKDEFKERLYEVFGAGDELEERIERAALAILFSVTGSELAAGVSVMVESNFDARSDVAPFARLRREQEPEPRLVQIHCGGPIDTLVEGFAERSQTGSRHPGHEDDPGDADEVRRKLEAGLWDPLDLPGELVDVDVVTDDVDIGELAARVRDAIGRADAGGG
jgi:predicted kinase